MAMGLTRRVVLGAGVGVASASLFTRPTFAQSWRPTKPIRMIVGDTAGGGTDTMCRIFVEFLTKRLEQTVIADNRSGANGVVAATELRNAAPDGYTLLYMVGSAWMTQKLLHKNLPYDPIKDFEPVAAQPVSGLPLIVHSALGIKTIEEFVDFARKNPVNVGTYGAGSLAHVGVAALEREYKVPLTPVHYRGSSQMWADVASGTLHAGIASAGVGRTVIDMERGVALAIQGRNRVTKYPGTPTFLELGAKDPGLSLMSVTGIVVPKGVPDEVIETISTLAVEAGKDEATWQKFQAAGADQRAIGRAEFSQWVKEEGPLWSELTSALALESN